MERRISRRRALHGAGGLALAAALGGRAAAAPDLTGRLARYMADAATRPLPDRVTRAAKQRILDTLAAMVSGAALPPGKLAIDYVRAQGGTAEACVATTDIVTTAVNAAFANGMLAHADETDDFHAFTKAHPGCSTVPAALAMAERTHASGAALVRAVVLGYDLCCRLLTALGPDALRADDRSVEGMSATFGAAAAAAAIARFDETRMRYAISYAAQQVSGVFTWERDDEHVEKAFDFGGMGARNGVAAATLVEAGFTGVADALEGERNVLAALRVAGAEPAPEALVADLSERFYIEETAIKTYPVGYPIQAPLDAFLSLVREQRLKPDDVRRIVARLPADGARIVDGRAMPDVNCQHILAVALVDGAITLENSHARERMTDPRVLAVRERVELVADPALVDAAAPRSGRVEVTLADGRKVERFVRHAPGTPENPLDDAGVNGKARGLIEPVLGVAKTDALIRRVNALDELGDVRELRALLMLAR
ncbi:MAG TPA: MmgE/PrpD family protein [Gammaproteobacteria bacterium]|nr:MmgE/PrpD family protein [Gammaproteobacteria bacterium]